MVTSAIQKHDYSICFLIVLNGDPGGGEGTGTCKAKRANSAQSYSVMTCMLNALE